MADALTWGGVVLVALVVIGMITTGVATMRWNRAVEDLRSTLEWRSRGPEGLSRPELEAVAHDVLGSRAGGMDAPVGLHAGAPVGDAGIPPVVRRYLERSLPPGGEPIWWATIQQQGTFQMGEGDAGWRPFTATQYIRAYPPGFLWDASIRMAPFVPVRVRDGYVNKRGIMKGALGAVWTVVDAAPTPELTEGALYRYLAEAAWIPSRLLPGEGLSWQEGEGNTAVATLTDSGVTVSVNFRFDDQADLVGIFVPSRGRDVDGVLVPTAWQGRFWDHGFADGFRVPREGEVAWMVDGDLVPYWRGRLVTVRYKKGS